MYMIKRELSILQRRYEETRLDLEETKRSEAELRRFKVCDECATLWFLAFVGYLFVSILLYTAVDLRAKYTDVTCACDV